MELKPIYLIDFVSVLMKIHLPYDALKVGLSLWHSNFFQDEAIINY